MKHMLNRSCKIWVKVEQKDYFYTVRCVTGVDDTHISFTDKFSKEYVFHKDQVKEIREVGEAW